MTKKYLPRSKKQRWVQERCYLNYGHLKGIISNLKHIESSSSTTYDEADILNRVVNTLTVLSSLWIHQTQKDISYDLYDTRTK